LNHYVQNCLARVKSKFVNMAYSQMSLTPLI